MNSQTLRRWVALTLAVFGLVVAIPGVRADVETEPPVVEAVFPEPGATHQLGSLEIHFSEAVSGVIAGDLSVNGVPCLEVRRVSPDIYVFTLPPLEPGDVEVKWGKNTAIVDFAEVPNRFAGDTYHFQLLPPARPGGVILSEILPDNQKILRDEDGDYVDWIELQNVTDQDVVLTDWHLSDDPADLLKWTFPEITLPARGFLVVYASGKNRSSPTNRLHTNFKLDNGGEYLGLSAPDGVVVNDFAPRYPASARDVSYGRAPGAPDLTGFFNVPTPGKPNDVRGVGFAPEVEFSVPGGIFTQNSLTLALALAEPAPGAVIRYTLDGKLPTLTNGFEYASPLPLTLSNAVILRARAFRSNYFPGPVHSETYQVMATPVLGEPVGTNASGVPVLRVIKPEIGQFRSDLPLIVLNTYGRSITEGANIPIQVTLFDTREGMASITNPPSLVTRGGIKVRGSSSASLSKKQYAVQWVDEFEQDRELSPLGMPSESEWVLYAPNDFEPVCIHNPFVYRLAESIGEYAPRTRFVEVFINRTGPLSTNQYAGLYVLEEKITIGARRVPGPKLQPEDNVLPDLSGPYLMKIDRVDPGDSGLSAGGQTVAMISPKEKEIRQPARAPQRKYLTDYLNAMARGFTAAQAHNPTNGYEAFVDVKKAIDYHLIETLSGNVDSMVLSAYFNKPRDGKLVFGPHWDFDRALGSTDGRDQNPRTWLTGPFFGGWLGQMLRDVEAWQRWVDRYQQLRTNQLSNRYTWSLMDQLANEIRAAQQRDLLRWRIPRRFGGYQGELDAMKRWVSNRLDFMDRQMAQPPVPSRTSGVVGAGETVTLSFGLNPSASAGIWYTLDGSDPRAAGISNPSPSALLYAGPITLSKGTRLVARTLDPVRRQSGGPTATTPWSAPVTRTWLLQPPALTLTELHFHPLGDGADSSRESDDFEFLELKNTSGRGLDLPGFRLGGDVEFVFSSTNPVTHVEANGRILLVKNRKAFADRYGKRSEIAGEYTGRLSDTGGQLRLTDVDGQVVFDFTYEDRWVPPADGFGHSLVVRSEALLAFDLDSAGSWVASAEVHGSPGSPDLASEASPDTDLNGNSLPDAWERAFFGLQTVDPDDDPDTDGFSNRQEFLAGTDPRSGRSAPSLEALPSPFGGSPILRFPRVGGRTYRLQYRDRLDPTLPWQDLLRFPGDVTTPVGQFRDQTSTNGTRFYRVATP